jgi:hypothetical protein
MEATLVIVKGKANKPRVHVRLPSVIGRSREADLRVAHPMVSRRHCQLYEENGLIKVRDLESLNGVFIGEQKVAEAVLPPNAVFSVGPLSFRAEYEYIGSPFEAPLAPDEDTSVDGLDAFAAPPAPHDSPTCDVNAPPDEIAPADGALPDFSRFASGGGPLPDTVQALPEVSASVPQTQADLSKRDEAEESHSVTNGNRADT